MFSVPEVTVLYGIKIHTCGFLEIYYIIMYLLRIVKEVGCMLSHVILYVLFHMSSACGLH